MDTTTDYKALYLKKFFQWQEISHQQRIRIEELNRRIEEYNQKYPEEYYEICTNEDLINLLPEPRRRYDCEDIVEKITDFTTGIEEMSDALDEVKNICRDISERCKKLGDYGDD